MNKRFLFLSIILLLCTMALFPQSPERREELIYSILAFDGKDYTGTFCREESDTIYLLADASSFLSLKKTFVYYWPITEEWKTDTEGLDINMAGNLEISGGKGYFNSISPENYTYFNIQGEYEKNWQVATGEEADVEWNKYMEMVKSYWSDYSSFKIRNTAYQREQNNLLNTISRLRDKGEDYSKELSYFDNLIEPSEPDIPDYYIVPPVELQKGFVVTLPEGEYEIRVRDGDGNIFSGSQKKLVIFGSRREGSIGFDVIPGDRWTRAVESNSPDSILYVSGKTDLYLRPFLQNEYQDLNYNKLKNNNSMGNPHIIRWQKIQQIPSVQIEVQAEDINKWETIKEEDFIVEQIGANTLGYEIVLYEPDLKHQGRKPSLKAFNIPLDDEKTKYLIRVLDENGTYLAGGERQIRVIASPAFSELFILIALIPIVFMLFVIILRHRKPT